MKWHPPSLLPLGAALGLLAAAAAGVYWQPGCGVWALTGWKCPGCGAGRAATALARGQLEEAFYWNALIIPALAGLVAAGLLHRLAWRDWLVAAGGVAAFTVLRNQPFYLLY